MILNQQFRAVWDRRFLIIGFVVLCAVLSYVYSSSKPDVFDANATVQTVSGREEMGEFVQPQELLATTNLYVQIANTSIIGERAADAYQKEVENSDGALKGSASNISVSARSSVPFVDFTASAADPADAAAFANAFAKAFKAAIDEDHKKIHDNQIGRIDDRITTAVNKKARLDPASAEAIALDRRIEAMTGQLAGIESQVLDTVRIVEPATPPGAPSAPKPKRDAILAAMAALIVAVTVAYALANFSDRYHSAEEIAIDVELPLLAELPRLSIDDPIVIESFRKLRTQLTFAVQKERHPVLLVTSAMPGAGKSHVSRGIGRAFAEEGQRTILADADLRRPTQHSAYGLPRAPGLADLLGSHGLTLAQLRAEHGSPHLVRAPGGEFFEVLPAGSEIGDPAGALSSAHMANLIDQLRVRYDVTVFDTPPVLPVVDTLGLRRLVDGVVLIIDTHRDKRSDVRRAVQTLRALDARLLGFVHNSAQVARARYEYSDQGDAAERIPARRP